MRVVELKFFFFSSKFVCAVGKWELPLLPTDNRQEGLQNPRRAPPLAMHIQARNVTTSVSDSARGPRSAYGLH